MISGRNQSAEGAASAELGVNANPLRIKRRGKFDNGVFCDGDRLKLIFRSRSKVLKMHVVPPSPAVSHSQGDALHGLSQKRQKRLVAAFPVFRQQLHLKVVQCVHLRVSPRRRPR